MPCSASLATIVAATPFDTDAQRNTVSRRDRIARSCERLAIALEEGDAAVLDHADGQADHRRLGHQLLQARVEQPHNRRRGAPRSTATPACRCAAVDLRDRRLSTRHAAASRAATRPSAARRRRDRSYAPFPKALLPTRVSCCDGRGAIASTALDAACDRADSSARRTRAAGFNARARLNAPSRMQFLKTLFWVLLAVVVALFASRNWSTSRSTCGATSRPTSSCRSCCCSSFLLGFLPTWLIMRARIWTHRAAHRSARAQPRRRSLPAATQSARTEPVHMSPIFVAIDTPDLDRAPAHRRGGPRPSPAG